MNRTAMLLEFRRLIDAQRMELTDLSIALSALETEFEAEAKQKLMAELAAANEFVVADHTDYKPE